MEMPHIHRADGLSSRWREQTGSARLETFQWRTQLGLHSTSKAFFSNISSNFLGSEASGARETNQPTSGGWFAARQTRLEADNDWWRQRRPHHLSRRRLVSSSAWRRRRYRQRNGCASHLVGWRRPVNGRRKIFHIFARTEKQERDDNETFRSIGSTLLYTSTFLHWERASGRRTIIGLFDLILGSLAVVARIGLDFRRRRR